MAREKGGQIETAEQFLKRMQLLGTNVVVHFLCRCAALGHLVRLAAKTLTRTTGRLVNHVANPILVEADVGEDGRSVVSVRHAHVETCEEREESTVRVDHCFLPERKFPFHFLT